jgi:glycosyltransferase involved in cell wall biosynthesis
MKPNRLQRAVSAAAVRWCRDDAIEAFRRHKTVFVSELLIRNFCRIAGPGPWGVVIHNFVDLDDVRAALAATDNQHLQSDNRVKVFVAGKLHPPKGIGEFLGTLIPCMPRDMDVMVAGDGPDEQKLRREHQSPRVRFLGWCARDETLRLMAMANVVVVPSVWEEPCGTTVLEGLLLGKPTFALAIGGTPELGRYAQQHDQLRLHTDMKSLVEDLVHYRPSPNPTVKLDGRGGIERSIVDLVKIYRAAPGPMTEDLADRDSRSY